MFQDWFHWSCKQPLYWPRQKKKKHKLNHSNYNQGFWRSPNTYTGHGFWLLRVTVKQRTQKSIHAHFPHCITAFPLPCLLKLQSSLSLSELLWHSLASCEQLWSSPTFSGTLWTSLPLSSQTFFLTSTKVRQEKVRQGQRRDGHSWAEEDVREGEIKKKKPPEKTKGVIIGQRRSDNTGKRSRGRGEKVSE